MLFQNELLPGPFSFGFFPVIARDVGDGIYCADSSDGPRVESAIVIDQEWVLVQLKEFQFVIAKLTQCPLSCGGALDQELGKPKTESKQDREVEYIASGRQKSLINKQCRLSTVGRRQDLVLTQGLPDQV